MKRIIFSLILALSLLFSSALTCLASESHPAIVDQADLLDSTQESALETKAQELRTQLELDIVILTINSLNGKSAKNYADDFFDTNGYGYNGTDDGVLLLLAMEEREWYFSTCGKAIYALTDYGIQELGELTVDSFAYGYDMGFDTFLSYLPDYFRAYETGAPIDGQADYSEDYYHGDKESVVYYEENNSPNLSLSLVVGLLAGGAAILIMRSSMNTKRKKSSASDYMRSGSYHLHTHRDLFLYSNVSKVRRQQNTSSGSQKGGSSVHRSSSGRRHSGGGGKF